VTLRDQRATALFGRADASFAVDCCDLQRRELASWPTVSAVTLTGEPPADFADRKPLATRRNC